MKNRTESIVGLSDTEILLKKDWVIKSNKYACAKSETSRAHDSVRNNKTKTITSEWLPQGNTTGLQLMIPIPDLSSNGKHAE